VLVGEYGEPNQKTLYIMVVEVIMVDILSHVPNWLEDLFAFDVPHLLLEPYVTY
jgi:hypothetical protein